LLSGARRLAGRLLVFARALSIPSPDGPVVGPTIFLTLEIEPGNSAKNLQPGRRVAADLDLGFNRSKRVEGLIEQIAYDANLRRVASRAHVVNRQVVVHAHMTFDEPGHLPVVTGAIESLEDQDVTSIRRATIARAAARLVWMRQGNADGVTHCRGVTRLGSPDTVRQTSLFHAAPCVPTA
jgi:hypothetical protein